MFSSNRNTPCAVCGRTKDADCRWADDVILCHSGTDLRPGQTIDANGREWAFIRHDGGYDGGAAVFKPHRPRSQCKASQHRPSVQDLSNRDAQRVLWSQVIEGFYVAFIAAWNVHDFHWLRPSELKAAFATIERAHEKGAVLSRSLQTIWRDHPDLKELHKLRVEQYIKHLSHQQDDAEHFKLHYLGEPSAAKEVG